MQEHIKRMLEEFDQLNARSSKLAEFIGGNALFAGLPEEDRDLLQQQYKEMLAYLATLTKRLERNDVNPYGPREQPEPTFGQKLVGIHFNPSGDDKVAKAKLLAAQLADIVNDHDGPDPKSYFNNTFKGGAIRRILDAQMWAVKHLTNGF